MTCAWLVKGVALWRWRELYGADNEAAGVKRRRRTGRWSVDVARAHGRRHPVAPGLAGGDAAAQLGGGLRPRGSRSGNSANPPAGSAQCVGAHQRWRDSAWTAGARRRASAASMGDARALRSPACARDRTVRASDARCAVEHRIAADQPHDRRMRRRIRRATRAAYRWCRTGRSRRSSRRSTLRPGFARDREVEHVRALLGVGVGRRPCAADRRRAAGARRRAAHRAPRARWRGGRCARGRRCRRSRARAPSARHPLHRLSASRRSGAGSATASSRRSSAIHASIGSWPHARGPSRCGRRVRPRRRSAPSARHRAASARACTSPASNPRCAAP